MANKWNIPKELEEKVRKRDTDCVYCRKGFEPYKEKRERSPSWEHVINDLTIITKENIVLCCFGCNSSKGQKRLSVWLQSQYCLKNEINFEKVSPIIKQAIENGQ